MVVFKFFSKPSYSLNYYVIVLINASTESENSLAFFSFSYSGFGSSKTTSLASNGNTF
jgi:hypothetical protein